MDPIFDRAVIVGAGLLGASLGLVMQATGAARHVVGVGRRQSSLDKALAVGAIHEGSLDLAAALAEADLVVVATPANTAIQTLDAIHADCPSRAVVIDVASTKAAICAHAAAKWPTPRRFIGCHPMAGSEKTGPEYATASLYRDTVCLIENSDDLDPDALGQVRMLWERAGARVVPIDAAQHDVLLARTSHVPHILSTILATAAGDKDATCDLIGNGFRDMTRVAAGSPEMWRDIALTNDIAIREGLEAVRGYVDTFIAALESGDSEALTTLFQRGKDAREKVVTE